MNMDEIRDGWLEYAEEVFRSWNPGRDWDRDADKARFDGALAAHDQQLVSSLLEEVYAVLGGRDLKYPEHFAFLASDNYLLGYRDALSDMRKAIETEKN
jgi:hypothetical protein